MRRKHNDKKGALQTDPSTRNLGLLDDPDDPFELEVAITKGVREIVPERDLVRAVSRHVNALLAMEWKKVAGRIVSRFDNSDSGDTFFIVTDSTTGSTAVLLPEEYDGTQ